jgi:hypothetical protein
MDLMQPFPVRSGQPVRRLNDRVDRDLASEAGFEYMCSSPPFLLQLAAVAARPRQLRAAH